MDITRWGHVVSTILLVFLISGCNPKISPEEGVADVVPRAICQSDDLVDTNLQGQVPIEDRMSGRAAKGYNCNLDLIGTHEGRAFASFDSYENCLYMPDQTWYNSFLHAGKVGFGTGYGIRVIDMSDPTNPVQTHQLRSAIALSPDESMTVNAKRGLLVMNSTLDTQIDIYDLEPDCAHPKLIGTFDMAPATGHAGWFSPDGMTYWMTSSIIPKKPNIFPIDLTDPTNPKLLAQWNVKLGTFGHNGWVSDDGKTAYACQAALFDGADNKVLVFRTPEPGQPAGTTEEHLINSFILDGIACQDIKAVSYNGKPFLIANSEYGQGQKPLYKGKRTCYGESTKLLSNFGVPNIFDISDIMAPKVVSRLMLEVDAPENCEVTALDQDKSTEATFPGELYDTHFCRPDRLKDPTILACARFLGGLEVYDIRDPYHPKELAYYRPGILGDKALANPKWGADPTSMEDCFAPPIVVASRGEIRFGCYFSGLHVVKFPESVYPFPESLTCNDDYYFNQYNPGFCPET